MVGNLKRALLTAAVLLLCLLLLGGCIDYESPFEGTSGSNTESTGEAPTESGPASSDTPSSEAVTDSRGYENEAEDGVSRRY